MTIMPETALYLPVKSFLESQGYTVKAEIHGCDVVACRGDDPCVIVELKTGLTLQLFYQAVDRLLITDAVYIAVPRPKRALPHDAIKLTRRLGLGLILVSKSGSVDVLADPAPYAPRRHVHRKTALLKEFLKRKGDPNVGGSTRIKLMTAYKQDALRCLAVLQSLGNASPAQIRKSAKVEKAATILRHDYYQWFTKQSRGVYTLTETGRAAAGTFAKEIASLG